MVDIGFPSGFRFRRSVQILPWVEMNVSKTGVSFSLGPDNLHITTGMHGTWLYADLPGKGAYYRRKLDRITGDDDNDGDGDGNQPQENPLELGFFERLTTPAQDVQLIEAMQALYDDRPEDAYNHAVRASNSADGSFLAGVLAFRLERYEKAIDHFKHALSMADELNERFAAHDMDIALFLPITDELVIEMRPRPRSVRLGLAETYQRLRMDREALQVLKERYEEDPQDVLTRLSMAELLDEMYPERPEAQQEIVKLAGDIRNDSPVHAMLMYYRGRALHRLELLEAARETFTKAMRKKKDYPVDLLTALRYQRARVYDSMGKDDRAGEEYEKVFARAPDFADVAERLGLELDPSIGQSELPETIEIDLDAGERDHPSEAELGHPSRPESLPETESHAREKHKQRKRSSDSEDHRDWLAAEAHVPWEWDEVEGPDA